MEHSKKVIISLIFIFIVGAFAGYYYGSGKQKSASKEIIYQNAGGGGMAAEKKDKLTQKVSLLKSYTDFVMLPAEKITEPEKYTDEMTKKLESINDGELTTKYNATGETENKEQKILDFLDYLNESIKADLQ